MLCRSVGMQPDKWCPEWTSLETTTLILLFMIASHLRKTSHSHHILFKNKLRQLLQYHHQLGLLRSKRLHRPQVSVACCCYCYFCCCICGCVSVVVDLMMHHQSRWYTVIVIFIVLLTVCSCPIGSCWCHNHAWLARSKPDWWEQSRWC